MLRSSGVDRGRENLSVALGGVGLGCSPPQLGAGTSGVWLLAPKPGVALAQPLSASGVVLFSSWQSLSPFG